MLGEDMNKGDPLPTASGNANWYSHHGKQHGGSTKELRLSLTGVAQWTGRSLQTESLQV